MTFLRPELLPILLLVPLVGALLFYANRLRARRLERTLGRRAGPLTAELGTRRRGIKTGFVIAAVLLATLAASGPQWGQGGGPLTTGSVDMVVCLDVSRSMLARDIEPSRLESAKRKIRALTARAVGDRMALVYFAGEASLAVPLTRDLASLAAMVEPAGPLSVPRGGTDLGAALLSALDALEGRGGGREVVLLLTDGDDETGTGRRMAETLRERGVVLHCIGFGTELGGKIPIVEEGVETFLEDRAGNEVVSALDGTRLEEMARATGGRYVTAAAGPPPLVTLYEERVLPMAREMIRAEKDRDRKNRFQWPLLAAFLLLTVNLGWSERRR